MVTGDRSNLTAHEPPEDGPQNASRERSKLMNNPEPPESDAAPSPATAVPPAAPGTNLRAWLRRLLFCNPFFLCSAALLLFGVNRLSTEDRLFTSDVQNLLFNFFSLQAYEVALILTALFLARRRIWYDSALLVVLEHSL